MISSAQLAAFQAAAKAAMDQAITIKRNTAGSSDGAGGTSESLTTVTSVVGNLAQPTAELMQNYDYLIGSVSAWLVRMPVSTNVKEADVLVVGSMKLRVQVLFQPQSYQTAMLLLCAEVQ